MLVQVRILNRAESTTELSCIGVAVGSGEEARWRKRCRGCDPRKMAKVACRERQEPRKERRCCVICFCLVFGFEE